jgi:hypothetical protein
VLSVLRRFAGASEISDIYGQDCAAMHPQRRMAIHVRCGDVTNEKYETGTRLMENVHGQYGPFPTSYSTLAMHEFLRKYPQGRVNIFCVDLSNPTCELFEHAVGELLLGVVGNVSISVNGTLQDDLESMACSNEIVMLRGTFMYVLMLPARISHVHTFGDLASGTYLYFYSRDCPTHNVVNHNCSSYTIHDRAEAELYETIGSRNWNNSEYQRHIINKLYKMEEILLVTMQCDARHLVQFLGFELEFIAFSVLQIPA